MNCQKVKFKVNVCFYIAQYLLSSPLFRSKRFTLHPSGRPVHSDTNSAPLGSILRSSHAAIMHEDYSLTFPPLFIDRYSFIQLSELGHCGENENAKTLKW